ncbi:Putative retroelement [Phytophthora palmivora]|uniref:Retroelement n=1 Tax=Phytophthora palmivora TaxID=4796 RepID=A0A2P4YG55_9STRA|nr:Putative retroelement [Phytophthora palmivora]
MLGMRSSEPLSRARRGVEKPALQRLFYDLTKLVIEQKLDGRRVWNMDETSFVNKHTSRTVLALRGSSNVWSIAPETTFHLSVVAAINAAGAAAPPLFILPGIRLRRTTLDGSAIRKAGVITAPKGFLNSAIFEKWIGHFMGSLDEDIERPIVLVCDGCSSHLEYDAERRAKALVVILLCLPPNATHLIQPLDVAVTCGIFPPYLPNMVSRLNKSKANGAIRSEIGLANWLRVRDECRESILVLSPSPARKKGSRKTVDSTEKIIRVEDMLVSPPRKKRRPSTKNTEQQPENAPLSVLESVSSNESVVE